MKGQRNIVRVEKNKNYTTINNTSIQDNRLTWKAKAIHVFMLSRPDDWVFYNEELIKWAKDGKDAFLSGLKELKKYGYIKKEKRRNVDGTFDWITVVHEIPQPHTDLPRMEKPSMDKPYMEKPSMENPTLLSTNKPITDSLSTNELNTEGKGETAPQSPLIDNDFLAIKIYYEQNVIYAQSSFSEDKRLIDMLDDYRDHLLIIEAMKIAVERGKPKLAYINGILKGWRNEDGITNHKQLEAFRKRGGECGTNQPNTSNDDGKKSRIQEANARRAALLRGESHTAN